MNKSLRKAQARQRDESVTKIVTEHAERLGENDNKLAMEALDAFNDNFSVSVLVDTTIKIVTMALGSGNFIPIEDVLKLELLMKAESVDLDLFSEKDKANIQNVRIFVTAHLQDMLGEEKLKREI